MSMYIDCIKVPVPVKTMIKQKKAKVKKMFGLKIPKHPDDARSNTQAKLFESERLSAALCYHI